MADRLTAKRATPPRARSPAASLPGRGEDHSLGAGLGVGGELGGRLPRVGVEDRADDGQPRHRTPVPGRKFTEYRQARRHLLRPQPDGDPPVAEGGGPSHRPLAVARDQHWRHDRARGEGDLEPVPEHGRLPGDQRRKHPQVLVGPAPPVGERHPGRAPADVPVHRVAGAHPEREPVAGDVLQRADLLGRPGRPPEREQHHPVADRDALRHRRRGREYHRGVEHRGARNQVVGRPHRVEPPSSSANRALARMSPMIGCAGSGVEAGRITPILIATPAGNAGPRPAVPGVCQSILSIYMMELSSFSSGRRGETLSEQAVGA